MVGGVVMATETYEGTIKLMGPVHIGSGKILKKQDYIYDFYNSTVHMVDGNKLIKFLKRNKLLTSYQEFLRYPPKNPKEGGLKRYLEAQNIKQSEWDEFISYSEKVNQGKKHGSVRPKPLNDLHVMVRDGQNEVYIPGSSIKGAIKTALVSTYNNEKDTEVYSKIKISDSEPINESNLAIYQKIDINKNEKPMPLYRECIEVGTEIKFNITIEDAVYSIKEIEKAIQNFYKNYYYQWLEGFQTTRGGKQFAIEGGIPDVIGQNILFLGAGAGFVSKTLHYQIKNKEQAKRDTFEILRKRFRNTYGKMKRIPDNVPVVLKGTTNQSIHKSYQQGMCSVTFAKK